MLTRLIYILCFVSFLLTQVLQNNNLSDLNKLSSKSTLLNNQQLDDLLNDDKKNDLNNIPKFKYEKIEIDTNQDSINDLYFGYEYFFNQSKLLNIDNLPIPNDYILGPGDEIIISIWGGY